MPTKNAIATATAIVIIKQLLLATERRTTALGRCCPSIYAPEDIAQNMRAVIEAQKEVDAAILQLRGATGSRLKDYSNLEVALLAHLWCGIWSSERSLRIDSTDVVRICGANNVEEAEPLIITLLNGSSTLFRFLSISWEKERGAGRYVFSIHTPGIIHRLLFGKQATEEV